MDFSELWRWNGRVGRREYALVGVIGFAIKHNIDRAIAGFFFPQTNMGFFRYFFNYWAPLGGAARLTHLTRAESRFLATMVLTALPGGRTRLEGTTWYRNAIWPSQYWRV